MVQSPQGIQVSRDGVVYDATVLWRLTADYRWTVMLREQKAADVVWSWPL